MNNRRRLVIALGAIVLAAPSGSFAQQPTKVYRIGILGTSTAEGYATRVDAFRAGLRDLGYVEGKNVIFEYRWADNNTDRLAGLAVELVRRQIDVIVTSGTPGILAAKRATTTIPIVMATSGDPVVSGLVASLAQPSGNVTGMAVLGLEFNVKRLELLKEIMPRLTQVAYLKNPRNPFLIREFAGLEEAGASLKIKVHSLEARGTNDFQAVFSEMVKRQIGAVDITQDTLFASNYRSIANLALRSRLPSTGTSEFAEAGGMLGYGPNDYELFRRAAYFVDKILKGAKPADLPVEQPTKFELIVNMKTAKALGIKIPDAIVLRADKVIE